MTFGAIASRIAGEIGDDTGDLETEIKQHIVDAIDFYKTFRLAFNEGIVTSTTVSSVETLDFPSRLISPDIVRITINANVPYDLVEAHWDEFNRWRVDAAQTVGPPVSYAVYGEKLYLSPIPDGAYALEFSGVLDATTPIEASSSSATSNWWTTRAPVLIRSRARMTLARDELRDPEGMALAAQAESQAYERLRREWRKKNGLGRIRPRGVLAK